MKSIHVLFTGLVTNNGLSGGDQLFLDIAPRMPKDIKIVVIMPYFATGHWDNIDKSNIEFRLLRKNIFDLKQNTFFVFLSYVIRAWQTYRILKNEDVQVIYSSSDIAYADIWPAFFLIKRNRDIRWVSRVYHILLHPSKRKGNFLTNFFAYYLQRLSFYLIKKRATDILALNDNLYEEMLQLDFPKDRLGVLGAGIDYQSISSFKPTKKYNYDAVVLGRISPSKGIYDMVDIWKKVHVTHPDSKLAWIGERSNLYSDKVERELEKISLSDSFHFLGFIAKEEIFNIFKSAKIFLCPDHENGWGLAVCEAMASKLPVVSYDIDIFGGVYKKGFRSVPLFDTDSFAKEIVNLLDNPDLRKKISGEAFDQVKEFDHNKIVDKLLEIIYK